MRRELAVVLETYNNNIAKVQLQRSSSCDGCKICSTGKPIILRANNNINASNGDNVIIASRAFTFPNRTASIISHFFLSFLDFMKIISNLKSTCLCCPC